MYYNQLITITFKNLEDCNNFIKNNKHMMVARIYTDKREGYNEIYGVFIDTRKF